MNPRPPASPTRIPEFQLPDIKEGSHRSLTRTPFVIRGAAADWPACANWKGDPGLERLEALAGDAEVQVMVSKDGVFHGDMSKRACETIPFKKFLLAARVHDAYTAKHWYLAQATISNTARPDGQSDASTLHALAADFDVRDLMAQLTDEDAHSINLWMQQMRSASSLHYDPYENLLCVISGTKSVHCFSPEATPGMYPLPLWGESSNHSCVNFSAPDLKLHPLYTDALKSMLTADLQAGDAIFIPEGWWHQIDSAANTIAVNIWWRSAFDKQLGSHMDSYYLTRTLQSLTEKQKPTLLRREVPLEDMGLSQLTVEQLCRATGVVDKEVIQSAVWALAESEDRPAWKKQRVEPGGKHDQQGLSAVSKLWGGRGLLQCFQSHPADFLVETLRHMLAHQPDGLRRLLTCDLSPGFAELLTSKLEERAAECGGKHAREVQELMEGMYKMVGDASSLMDSLVEQKEAFAREACRAALRDATGMSAE